MKIFRLAFVTYRSDEQINAQREKSWGFWEIFCIFYRIPSAYDRVELIRPSDTRFEYDDLNIADLHFNEGRLFVDSHESVRIALGLPRSTLTELPRTLLFRMNFRSKNWSETPRDVNVHVKFFMVRTIFLRISKRSS